MKWTFLANARAGNLPGGARYDRLDHLPGSTEFPRTAFPSWLLAH